MKTLASAAIRVFLAPEHRVQLAMLEIDAGTGGDRELFIFPPTILPAVSDLPGIRPRVLMLCVAKPEFTPLRWPIKTPKERSGRKDTWSRSALEIARLAMKNWLRVTPVVSMGSYMATVAKANWPERSPGLPRL